MPKHRRRLEQNTVSSISRVPLFLFGVHSMAGLALEVSLIKAAGLSFGHDLPAAATVVALYVAGLALGAFLVDRAPRSYSPLLLFAGNEVLLGLTAFFLPQFLKGADVAFVLLSSGLDGNMVFGVRFLTAATVLLPSAALSGAAFPLISRCQDSAGAGPPRSAAFGLSLLYATGTIGAAIGAWAGAVFLLPATGTYSSLQILGICYLAIAAMAATLQKKIGLPGVPPGKENRPLQKGNSLLNLLAVLLGIALFTSEMGWLKLLWLTLDPTPYVTGTTLAVIILAMALGAGVAVYFTRHGSSHPTILALSVSGGALASLVVVWAGARPAIFSLQLLPPGNSFAGYLLATALAVFLLVAPSAFCHGAALISLLALQRDRFRDSGRAASRLSALHAAGSATGALLVPYWLLPELGLARTLALPVMLLASLPLIFFFFARDLRNRYATAAALPILLAAPFVTSGSDITGAADSPAIIFHREDGSGVTEVVRTRD
ncbi:MAG: hypothetical protein ACE5JX_20400, partial [Acidobacteriota bacterium]